MLKKWKATWRETVGQRNARDVSAQHELPDEGRPTKKRKTSQHASTPSEVTLIDRILEHAKQRSTIAFASSNLFLEILAPYIEWAVNLEKSGREISPAHHRVMILMIDDVSDLQKYEDELNGRLQSMGIRHSLISDTDVEPTFSLRTLVLLTPEIALKLLLQGRLRMIDVHTATYICTRLYPQHLYSRHPLSRIMQEFYHVADASQRPRLLTLCPKELASAPQVLHLEATLDSTALSAAQDQHLIDTLQPNDVVVPYDDLGQQIPGQLPQQMHRLADPSDNLHQKYVSWSHIALSELGPCASDLVWKWFVKELDDTLRSQSQGKSNLTSSRYEVRRIIADSTFSPPCLDVNSQRLNVSPKFLKLVEILVSCEPLQDTFRGIILVQYRIIALVLVEMLEMLGNGLEFLRPCVLVDMSETSDQVDTLNKFTSGHSNLLIATKLAEDLVSSDVYLTIRFNVFDCPLSYLTSRAWTFGSECNVIHMVERNNNSHRKVISQITSLDAEILRWSRCLRYGESTIVPPSNFGNLSLYHYPEDDGDQQNGRSQLIDPTTGLRITAADATVVVYRYACDAISDANRHRELFEYAAHDDQGLITCTVRLSGTLIDKVSGLPSVTQAHARRSACLAALRTLAKEGKLNYRLYPAELRWPSCSSAPQDAPLRSRHRFYIRRKPIFWENSRNASGNSLYPVMVSLDNATLPQTHPPILLLTRRPLPEFPDFRLFFSGLPFSVRLTPSAPLLVTISELDNLYRYTERMCRLITNKPYHCLGSHMVYFFAPLSSENGHDICSKNDPTCCSWDARSMIDWDQVSAAAKAYAVPLTLSNYEDLVQSTADSVIQDRWVEFTRRYDVVTVRSDLTPLSKPADSLREADYDSLVDYCKARQKGFTGLKDYNQHIVEVTRSPILLNHLNPASQPTVLQPAKPTAKYLIPELCAKITVPASTFRSMLLLPSILRRIDDLLLVKELNAKLFTHKIREDLLHVALCSPSAGVEYDYERLELLGDAFLKYVSSLHVFVMNPTCAEGHLHAVRQSLISNKSLFVNACVVDLPAYIQSKPFVCKSWHPPGFELEYPGNEGRDSTATKDNHGEANASNQGSIGAKDDLNSGPSVSDRPQRKKGGRSGTTEDSQWLGDKAIADVAEAILGAAHISGGDGVALMAMKALNIAVLGVEEWADFGRSNQIKTAHIVTTEVHESIMAVESIIGWKFSRPELLIHALSHSPSNKADTLSYERLEFLGDGILDFMAVRHIFNRDQKLSPGGLTLLKGAMVSNAALAAICVSSGLHEHLFHGSYELSRNIQEYVTKLGEKARTEYEAAASEGRVPGQYWIELDPPKALSDMIESIIGAIYISEGFSPQGAEAMYAHLLQPFYDKHVTFKTLSYHPTKLLLEILQAQGCTRFETEKEQLPNGIRYIVLVHDVVLAKAEDAVLATAARWAALSALDALEGDPGFLVRTCDCRARLRKLKKKETLAEFELLKEAGES